MPQIIGIAAMPIESMGFMMPWCRDSDGNYFEAGCPQFRYVHDCMNNYTQEELSHLLFADPIPFIGDESELKEMCDECRASYAPVSLLYLRNGCLEAIKKCLNTKEEQGALVAFERGIPAQSVNHRGYAFYVVRRKDVITQCYLSRLVSTYRRMLHYVIPTRWSDSNKKEFQNYLGQLFLITHDKRDIDRYLPMHLACDGDREWTKDDWSGLYAFADTYAKRWGITISSPEYWRQRRSEALMKLRHGG